MKQSKVLLLVKEVDLYFFPYVNMLNYKKYKIECHAVLDNNQFGSWINNIDQFDLIIFLDYGFEPYMARFVRRITNAKIILFLWNYIDRQKITLLNTVIADKSINTIYTFDKVDALKYKLKHNSSFYSKIEIKDKLKIEYDVFFGGSNQNRSQQLLEMKTIFDQQKISFSLYCPDLLSEQVEDFVSYEEYLNKTLKAKAILEILKDGQTGISLRTLEALHYKKLLITSNKLIKYYQFYNPNNIFIIGEDNLANLGSFLKNKYQTVNLKTVRFYDIANWVERFMIPDETLMEQHEFNTPLFLNRKKK